MCGILIANDGLSPSRALHPGRRSLGFSACRSTPPHWKAFAAEHPDPASSCLTQYSLQPFSRSTSRRKTPCQGFQDIKRYTRRGRHGRSDTGPRHRVKECLKLHPQERLLFGALTPGVGASRAPAAAQALKLHARQPSPCTPSCLPGCPPAGQVVHAPFELGVQVLLITPPPASNAT